MIEVLVANGNFETQKEKDLICLENKGGFSWVLFELNGKDFCLKSFKNNIEVKTVLLPITKELLERLVEECQERLYDDTSPDSSGEIVWAKKLIKLERLMSFY